LEDGIQQGVGVDPAASITEVKSKAMVDSIYGHEMRRGIVSHTYISLRFGVSFCPAGDLGGLLFWIAQRLPDESGLGHLRATDVATFEKMTMKG
jgi:hypothetical protein